MAFAVLLLVEKLLKGISIYNVGEYETPTMKQRVEMIAELMKKKVVFFETDEVPDELSVLKKKANDFVVDSTKIRNEIGYKETRSVIESYQDTVKWILSSAR